MKLPSRHRTLCCMSLLLTIGFPAWSRGLRWIQTADAGSGAPAARTTGPQDAQKPTALTPEQQAKLQELSRRCRNAVTAGRTEEAIRAVEKLHTL